MLTILYCDYMSIHDALIDVSVSCCDPLAVSLTTTESTSLPVMPSPTPSTFPPTTGLPHTTPIALSTSSSFIPHPSIEPNSLPVMPSPTPSTFPPATDRPHTTAPIPILKSTSRSFLPHPSVEPNSLPVMPSPTPPTVPLAMGLPHTTAPIPIALSITNTFVQHPSVEPTSLLGTGTERSTIVAAVLSVLFVAIVGTVAMVLVAVFVYRRKKSKQVVLHSTAFTNPVYEGKNFNKLGKKFLNIYCVCCLFVCLFVCLFICLFNFV